MLQMSFLHSWKFWENHVRKNPAGFRSCSPLFKQTKNCFLFLKYCIFWLCSAMTDKIYLNCSLKSCTILYFELLLERILHQLTELLKGTNKRSIGAVACVGLKNYIYRLKNADNEEIEDFYGWNFVCCWGISPSELTKNPSFPCVCQSHNLAGEVTLFMPQEQV